MGYDLYSYDRYIVAFSGGADSLGVLLYLLECGVPAEKILLHHHLVDGREGSTLMDWPVTESYCAAVAKAFDLPISYSWRQGGFEAEMCRENVPTKPCLVPQLKSGDFKSVGGEGSPNTRQKFPQKAADLKVRWCSAALKIGPMDAWLANDETFANGKTLILTGERAEESTSRAGYAIWECHRRDLRNGHRSQRWVDHHRPLHAWKKSAVWDLIGRWGVTAHPAYHLGWGRTSCMKCIFGSKNQWASIREIDRSGFQQVAEFEVKFQTTIDRKLSVIEMADAGTPYAMTEHWRNIAMAREFTLPVITSSWELPQGAYGESCGPT